MKDRPILFAAPMVRGLLDGTKTQTRRIIKPQPVVYPSPPYNPKYNVEAFGHILWQEGKAAPECMLEWCPFGQIGDQLWVRESFKVCAVGMDDLAVVYTADNYAIGIGVACGDVPDSGLAVYYRMFDRSDKKPRGAVGMPSIHMPRWLSRIQLEITGVRVERLNDISYGDASAEGVGATEFWNPKEINGRPFEEKWWDDFHFWTHYPQLAYQKLWESLNGPGSWAANPWVWAIEFRRVKP